MVKNSFDMIENSYFLGFFYVKNHGVDKSLVHDVFEMGHQFFSESEEVKSEILMKYAGKAFRGYFKVIISFDEC